MTMTTENQPWAWYGSMSDAVLNPCVPVDAKLVLQRPGLRDPDETPFSVAVPCYAYDPCGQLNQSLHLPRKIDSMSTGNTHRPMAMLRWPDGMPATLVAETIYDVLQRRCWSPNGEAVPMLRKLGIRHVSMCPGDIVLFGNEDTERWYAMMRLASDWYWLPNCSFGMHRCAVPTE